ncbi:hypothetical protein [Pendulispora albinea]|uniref:Glycosyltransferase RgtA/B/C/D-like domain-containing protein n=1 Tax=Pendulispora albinea TaxID=2741071 RepID=A0ABZ2LZE4_9BACT
MLCSRGVSPESDPVQPVEPPQPPAPAPDPGFVESLRQDYGAIRDRWLPIRDRSRRFLARFDPNDDPLAEPLTLLPLVVLFVALAFSVWTYWRWKFQPMQDLGHHIGLSAVVADYGRAGSIYPPLYDPPNPLNANALLYFVAGYAGKIIGVTPAVRLGMTFYLVGVPLANLYALRAFGRSAWGAVLSVPLVYNMNYVGGFANLLFAAPFMVLAIPVFHQMLEAPTRWRVRIAAILLICTFLAHAHAFLWTGALTFVLTLYHFVRALARSSAAVSLASDGTRTGGEARARLIGAAKVAMFAFAAALPSLLLFFNWYTFAFGSGKIQGAGTTGTVGIEQNFAAEFKTPSGLFHDLFAYALNIYTDDSDMIALYGLGGLALGAIAFSRLHHWRKPPVLEAAFAITVISYFFLPEAIASNPVVGSRQIGVSLWLFFSAIVTPVPARVSRFARFAVVAGIVLWTGDFLRTWYKHLVVFEQTEANGIEFVLEQTPYRQNLHMVKVSPDTSAIFAWKPNWHVDKYYMSDRFGQVPDNPAIVSTSSIRYRAGIDFHRITGHSADWSKWPEVWNNFELVLVHGWNPTRDQLAAATQHGVRIRKMGDWELWRKKGDWQTQGDGPAPRVP